MDPQNSKKQSFKIIFSETLMFLAVVITVIILVLLVSGYWLNSNFQVERNGLLQVSSFPSGANIEIDGKGSSWLERTNSSKILASGEHSILLTKDEYDTWSKSINISEGLLYRLHYPRLFLENRTSDAVYNMEKYSSATVSALHNSMLLMNNTTDWLYLNLDADEIKPTTLDISSLFSSVSFKDEVTSESNEVRKSNETSESNETNRSNESSRAAGVFTGKILSANWDYDSSHVLFEVQKDNTGNIEWVLLDVNDVKKSINLTREFGVNFTRVEILDNNSNTLLAVQNQNLHKIDLPGRLISAILVEDVYDFDHLRNEIVFSTNKNSVGYFRLGESNITKITTTSSPARVAISRFYDDKYYTILDGGTIAIFKQDSLENEALKYDISFNPNQIKIGQGGEFILFSKDHQLASLDMEAKLVREWTIENSYGWLDNNMLYTIDNGDLIVYDFDGLNRRIIANNVSSRFPATITNDKWLYYSKDDSLMREVIAK